MKAEILDLEGKKIKTIDLPKQFDEEIRPDLIKRAVLAVQFNKRQKYGAFPKAGQRASARISKRRRSFKTCYGHGISRIPRKVIWRRGTQFGWIGAFAPGTVGGRRSHPPKATKSFTKKINIKERRKAIRSALSATIIKELVSKRGHLFNKVPLIIETKLETLKKTKEIKSFLNKIGLKEELERASIKKIRAGKGKIRGRKYKLKKGPLIVVSEKCPLFTSSRNIPGIDICLIKNLNAELLAPGCSPGRLTIYTEKTIEKLANENLFMDKK